MFGTMERFASLHMYLWKFVAVQMSSLNSSSDASPFSPPSPQSPFPYRPSAQSKERASHYSLHQLQTPPLPPSSPSLVMSYPEKTSSGDKLPSDSASLEKGVGTHPAGPNAFVTPADDDRYNFDAHDLDKVQRRLKQRHVQMIAIGK